MIYTYKNNGELNLSHVNESVHLRGWVQKSRNLGGLIFIDLRDRFGITQLAIRPENTCYDRALSVKVEYVLEVKGIVVERESKNTQISTGDIEIDVKELSILNRSETPPIIVSDKIDALEETRLKYRYLDLRRPVMQNFLIKRHEIMQSIRSVLVDEGFYELETPILGKSTPEGARDYLVPSRLYAGHFYALPQSPQIYKQLFMIAGFEKYFQIAKCFRDEDLRADRQPEFTQVDIELSFKSEAEIRALTERILAYTFKRVLNVDIKTPFMTMTYKEARESYGSDKPDLRFDLKIEDYKPIFVHSNIPLFDDKAYVKGIRISDASILSRKKIDKLTDLVKKNHGETLAYVKYANDQFSGSIAKFISEADLQALNLKNNEMIFLVPGKKNDVLDALGALRIELAKIFDLIDPSLFKFLWVIDFPLFEYSEEEDRLVAQHHPFTAPQDINEMKEHPQDALAKAYDVILNGYELGGGSIRIHDQNVQELMFNTLGLSEYDIKERFGFFVEALKYGTPPHGGIALGLDRLVMLMTHTTNIKDVIAFPKTQSAKDQMMQAPSEVDIKQIKELHLKVGESDE